ncbi:hypothetical protein CJF42_24305 [Pseudoalteromonas sp. NBT06-2]|uniref:hypothetical protein n=1 Tax=Pseudoalteromonas sp. NBT06-2 TaxID=2025950 RepID=UPI000BA78DF1|nr:hypothetical protein [Pseudoalteromonas sp. NBT06-2]PAJ71882.1 hypothetical protein CJF42_24305 [Pseudoalteromonas sp. NBT06-2]
MKVTLLSASLGKGVSKKTGVPKPYEFASLEYAVKAKDFSNDDHNIQKCGVEVKTVEIAYDQALYNNIKSITDQEGITLVDLTLEPNPENMSRNIVTKVSMLK